ncbi:hypothetical protein L1D13_24760, partial [Vibrio tubiashii]|uniref:hypothetical protein n=1 Tax=Vibrio tubiashii TaxID=29498 RepID=UPI001EFDC603
AKHLSTKSKTLLAEPFGQRLWLLSAVLSAYQVEQLQFKASALHKESTNCCKNQLKRSTDPNQLMI